MADDTDLKEFVHERFRRADEKADRILTILNDMVERFGSLEKQVAGLRVDFAHLREDLVRVVGAKMADAVLAHFATPS